MQKIRFIQWFTGEIARHQICVIAGCPSMDLPLQHSLDLGDQSASCG